MQPIEWDDLIRGHQKFDPEADQRPRHPPRRRQLALSAAERDRRHRPWRSPTSSAARTMSRTAPCSCRCSMRWAPSRRSSRMRRCWSRRRASCRSGSARTASSICARQGVEPMALLSLLARLGTSQPVEAVASLDELAEDVRLCAFRPGAGAFRSARRRAAQRQAAPPSRLCRRRRPLARGHRRGGMAGAARQPRPSRRSRRLGAGAPRRDRRRRKSCQTTSRCWPRRRRVAEAIDWSDDPWHALTDPLKAVDRPQGPGPVPPAAPGADRPRVRPGNGAAAQADRPGAATARSGFNAAGIGLE